MSNSSPGNGHEPVYLNTAEVAERMGVSEQTVRDLCRRGMLPGAFQERENGPWRIPIASVEAWTQQYMPHVVASADQGQDDANTELRREHRKSATPGPPTWWLRFRYNPWIFYLAVALTVLGAVLTLMAALISAGADFGGFRQQLQGWGLLREFAPANDDEILILIATFRQTEGVADTDAHNEIRRAIEQARDELGVSNLRVEVESTRLTADAWSEARALGKRYNASMVIWGADTGVRVTVNYLNLAELDYTTAEVTISETERTQLANPSAYATYITTGLPVQLTFLSLLAVGRSYYGKEDYVAAIRIIEKAISSLTSDTAPEGLADAYLSLGWLYQVPLDDHERAILNYNRVIDLNSDLVAEAYLNRGAIREVDGDLESAIADFDQAIALKPDLAGAYYNRGLARKTLDDMEGAIADFNHVIALEPNNAGAYYNRGLAREAKDDVEGAIADFDQAITLRPELAQAYHNRGLAYAAQDELERAIADFDQAIALMPNDAEAYYSRGLARATQGNLESAIRDFDQTIALKSDYGEAYFNRSLARETLGDLEGAITDFDQALALRPDLTIAYYFNRGFDRAARGNPDGAIEDYDRVISLKPDLAEAYYNRALARETLGDLEGAITDFDQVITLNQAFAEAYWGRGRVLQRLGNAEAALADFHRYIELRPDTENHKVFEEWIAKLEAVLSDQ